MYTCEITTETTLDACQRVIGYSFSNLDLLKAALTHASCANTRKVSNERLEFLGDAILGLIVCEELYKQFGELLEGDLTKIKSVVVSRRTCTMLSKQLGLEKFLSVGKGMQSLPEGALADVFESLVAAIYLDGGLEPAREFVLRNIGPEIAQTAGTLGGENHKSILQHYCQKEFYCSPTYQVLDEKGPDHAKCFLVVAVVGNSKYPAAWGKSKKEAEQQAACLALEQLQKSLTSSAS